MTLARSRRELVLGIVALIVLAFAAANIIDDRCSANISALDEPTWEEVRG